MPAPAISLRPATVADQAFLLRVYASTRAAELALTGWDISTCDAFVQMQFNAQATHYRQQWPASEHSVIEVKSGASADHGADCGTHAAGRLWLDRRVDSIHVLDIALLSDWCGQGIGSACLGALLSEASRSGRAVTIHVEQGNPARRLYDRLGFVPVGPQRGLHQMMAWQHPTSAISTPEEACYEQA